MRRLTSLLALLLCACGVGHASPSPTHHPGSTSPAQSESSRPAVNYSFVAGSPPKAGAPWFLTIGDSITSGYSRDPARQGRNSGWPAQLETVLARTQRPWRLYDVACPGETTESYRSVCSGRAKLPFLEHGSQHDAATAAITAHLPDLQLIIVDLGSNDLLLSQLHGVAVPDVVATMKSRLDGEVSELRRMAPRVPLMLLNFYDPFENGSPDTLTGIDMANSAVLDVAQHNGATLVDVFSAINTRTPPAPDLCLYLDCAHYDPVHPTVTGHARIAGTVAAAIPS